MFWSSATPTGMARILTGTTTLIRAFYERVLTCTLYYLFSLIIKICFIICFVYYIYTGGYGSSGYGSSGGMHSQRGGDYTEYSTSSSRGSTDSYHAVPAHTQLHHHPATGSAAAGPLFRSNSDLNIDSSGHTHSHHNYHPGAGLGAGGGGEHLQQLHREFGSADLVEAKHAGEDNKCALQTMSGFSVIY